MGWSQLSMLKRYGHVIDTMLADAGARLDQHRARVFGITQDAQATSRLASTLRSVLWVGIHVGIHVGIPWHH